MADKLGASQPTISRTESGERLPSVPFAQAWLNADGADDASRMQQ
jgi:transcriptional regulator with XRE-family HTH domain